MTQRETLLKNWLAAIYPNRPFELSFAAADADFRRYFRAKFADGETIVCMDAPPDKSCLPCSTCRRFWHTMKNKALWH